MQRLTRLCHLTASPDWSSDNKVQISVQIYTLQCSKALMWFASGWAFTVKQLPSEKATKAVWPPLNFQSLILKQNELEEGTESCFYSQGDSFTQARNLCHVTWLFFLFVFYLFLFLSYLSQSSLAWLALLLLMEKSRKAFMIKGQETGTFIRVNSVSSYSHQRESIFVSNSILSTLCEEIHRSTQTPFTPSFITKWFVHFVSGAELQGATELKQEPIAFLSHIDKAASNSMACMYANAVRIVAQ